MRKRRVTILLSTIILCCFAIAFVVMAESGPSKQKDDLPPGIEPAQWRALGDGFGVVIVDKGRKGVWGAFRAKVDGRWVGVRMVPNPGSVMKIVK